MTKSTPGAICAMLAILAATPASAGTLTDILYAAQTVHLNQPVGPVAVDAAGNVYACAYYGGTRHSYHEGAVFKLTPPAAGQTAWTPTTLYTFTYPNGFGPNGVSFLDGSGALYGTTNGGGPNGAGTVFKLSPPATGQTAWTMTLLHGFSNSEGSGPSGRLAMDAQGNLFGSASIGGTGDNGTVFELSPPAAGGTAWAATMLHVFSGADGRVPNGVILTARGALVGSTADYGTNSNGRVFELSPPIQGQTGWTLATLHHFNGTDGATPASELVADQNGVLYGTTSTGGNGYGVVFRLAPPDAHHANWTEDTLHSFSGPDGFNPGDLQITPAGALIGTTGRGGQGYNPARSRYGSGTVYELTPPALGFTAWSETLLHSFTPKEGTGPSQPLLDQAGTIFGLTAGGAAGAHYGTVFRLTP